MSTTGKLAVAGSVIACAGAATLPPALAAAPTARAARTTTVVLEDIAFKRSSVRVAKGSSVTWVWRDGQTRHNVTFADRRSRTRKTGTYTVRFTRIGTFRYVCTLHPGMDGKVTVR